MELQPRPRRWRRSRLGRSTGCRSLSLHDGLPIPKAEARRWVERLGGQVMNLTGTNEAAKQAIADASERYTAAGAETRQARRAHLSTLVTETALKALSYVQTTQLAMDLDPGPDLTE